ncbi:hypothetical protein DSCA_46040 [Desulfosarcina alkanivorans]|uniref:Uncharacterized protein n=1 Tax=Desulfosarcina alkanivorans TaxID=571177 RepID=A0A5K7YWJ7_9BACT|nr:hypothetical protein DSCA_46040 [Desulfosarcina alkanivorans]
MLWLAKSSKIIQIVDIYIEPCSASFRQSAYLWSYPKQMDAAYFKLKTSVCPKRFLDFVQGTPDTIEIDGCNVGIEHGRFQAAMPKQFLNGSNIRAVFK